MSEPIRVIEGSSKPHEAFWNFRNSSESESGEVELEFFGPISEYSWFGDEVTPAKFKKDLYGYGQGKPITMLVNSPGGEVIAASVIRSTLQEYPGKVTADIVGMAASAATIVITGADHIRMRESSLFMIHDPSMLTWGTIDELKKALDILKTVKNSIIDTYVTKTKMEPDKLAKMMTDETWMTANEAWKFGFVDEVVTGSVKKSAMATNPTGFVNCLKNYQHVPDALLGMNVVLAEVAGPLLVENTELQRRAKELRDYLDIYWRKDGSN